VKNNVDVISVRLKTIFYEVLHKIRTGKKFYNQKKGIISHNYDFTIQIKNAWNMADLIRAYVTYYALVSVM